MPVEMEDKTGQIRRPEEFAEAAKIVKERIVKSGIPDDIPLFMQFTTILQALYIAEAVSTARLLAKGK